MAKTSVRNDEQVALNFKLEGYLMKHLFSRSTSALILILACCALLAGCTREEATSLPSDREIELLNRISELEIQLESQLQSVPIATVRPSPEPGFEEWERDRQLLDWYEDTLTRLTNTPNPEYEVVHSDSSGTIVFVKNAPGDYHASGIFLIRIALEFADTEHVTFWTSLDAAKEYVAGRVTKVDDTIMYMHGQIVVRDGKWILEQHGSTGGPSPLRFGKFVRG